MWQRIRAWLTKATSVKNLSFGGKRANPGVAMARTTPVTMNLQKDWRDMPANQMLRSQKLCITNHITIRLPSTTNAKYEGKDFFTKKRDRKNPDNEGSGSSCR